MIDYSFGQWIVIMLRATGAFFIAVWAWIVVMGIVYTAYQVLRKKS